jgi:hypothetical protein
MLHPLISEKVYRSQGHLVDPPERALRDTDPNEPEYQFLNKYLPSVPIVSHMCTYMIIYEYNIINHNVTCIQLHNINAYIHTCAVHT